MPQGSSDGKQICYSQINDQNVNPCSSLCVSQAKVQRVCLQVYSPHFAILYYFTMPLIIITENFSRFTVSLFVFTHIYGYCSTTAVPVLKVIMWPNKWLFFSFLQNTV